MNILNNYLLVFSRWKDFKGRSGLAELWSFKIIDFLIIGLLFLLAHNVTQLFLLACLSGIILAYSLFAFIPYYFLLIRRIHDLGHSGWWSIPILFLNIYIIICLFDSNYSFDSNTISKYFNPYVFALLFSVVLMLGLMYSVIGLCLLFAVGDKRENKYGLPLESSKPSLSVFPKGKITHLEIIYNSLENRYSIAKMNWNGLENCYAIRWNLVLKSWVMIPQRLVSYIDFERFLSEKELYTLIADKILTAVKQQKEINPSLFSLSVSYNLKEIDREKKSL